MRSVTENSWKNKNRNRKTNQAHSRDLMHSTNNANKKMTDNKPLVPDVPFHPCPVHRPPPKPIRHDVSNQQGSQSSSGIEDIDTNINFSISGGCYVQNFPKTGQVIFPRT